VWENIIILQRKIELTSDLVGLLNLAANCVDVTWVGAFGDTLDERLRVFWSCVPIVWSCFALMDSSELRRALFSSIIGQISKLFDQLVRWRISKYESVNECLSKNPYRKCNVIIMWQEHVAYIARNNIII